MSGDEFALVPGFEVLHFIEIRIEELGPRAKLICHAAKGATCRMRPADPDVDEWDDTYQGEMIDNDCFAVEWLEAADWEGVTVLPYDKPVATIPVSVGYDGYSAVLAVLTTPSGTTP